MLKLHFWHLLIGTSLQSDRNSVPKQVLDSFNWNSVVMLDVWQWIHRPKSAIRIFTALRKIFELITEHIVASFVKASFTIVTEKYFIFWVVACSKIRFNSKERNDMIVITVTCLWIRVTGSAVPIIVDACNNRMASHDFLFHPTQELLSASLLMIIPLFCLKTHLSCRSLVILPND